MITKYRNQTARVHPFVNLMTDAFGQDISQFFGNDELQQTTPKVNITETPARFTISLTVPGFSKDQISVTSEQDVVTVKAEKAETKTDEGERFLRREFHSNAFSRSFRLPDTVNAEGITAEQVDGVLRIHVPKAEPTKPVSRTIAIG